MKELLSRKMILALSDAQHASVARGLERSRGAFISTRGGDEIHHRSTISALIDRGYLQLYSNGKVAHITDAGERALERVRE